MDKLNNLEPSKMQSKIDNLLLEMTIDEKIGQLNQVGTSIYGDKEELYEPLVRAGKIGSFLSISGIEKLNKLQKIAVEESRLKIPLLFGFDVIHGFKTIFPIPLAESCSWDENLAQKTAEISAIESWAAGIHWTFAPMLDVARDARWGRISEGFGEDPYLTGVLGAAKVKGYQGDNLSKNGNILACAKHFAAYGGAESGRDYNTVDISFQKLQDIYLPPFKKAIDAGVGTVMTAFNDLNGVPCTANKYLLKDVLIDQLKFSGFIVTDFNSIGELVVHGFSENLKAAAKAAINLGVNMDMSSSAYGKCLKKLLEEGAISIDIIDNAVMKILEFKYKLGLFDNPYKSDINCEEKYLLNQKHLKLAREAAQKSIVLLKNKNNILPLKKDINKLALIGPFIENKEDLLGSWAFSGDVSSVVTVYEGLKSILSEDTEILKSRGCNINDDNRDQFKEAIEIAEKSDIIIAVLGESADMSGEAHSRTNIGLPGIQEELLQNLYNTGKDVILVLINGRPLSIPWAAKNIPAIIEAWQLGTESGNAICDVLFGAVNPSGKLTTTFPHTSGQLPIYYNQTSTGRPAKVSKNAWDFNSKYLDCPIKPLYPFGFGLSYTEFKYSNLEIINDTLAKNETLKVNVLVENIGDILGDEIIQVYIQDLFASRVRPVKELKSFKKISLEPGEKKKVEFSLDVNNFGFYNQDMEYVVEPGEFKIYIGTNSENVIEGKFKVI